MTHTEALAARFSALEYEDLPPSVVQKLEACLLYGLTMSATAPAQPILDAAVLAVCQTPGNALLLVDGQRRNAADAAYANAFRMCARGQNDTFQDIYAHPGCIVIPVVLALGQERGISGREMFSAMAAGYEALACVAAGYASAVVQRRFRATSVFGVIAATAAAARVLRLDADHTAHALALATQQAAGTMQCWTEGSPEWRLQVATASRAGIVCATLAAHGYTAARQSLEGDSGLYRTFAGMAPRDATPLSWQTPTVIFKPLPGCLINQAPLYMLLALRRQHGLDAAQVDHVDVVLSSKNEAYPGINRHGPFETPTGAIMSCPFMLAVGLRDGTLRMSDFDLRYAEDDIHALSQSIRVYADDQLPDWGATVSVHLKDGRTVQDTMTDPSRFSFTWDETDTLLATMAAQWPWPDGADRHARLRAAVSALDTSRHLDDLLNILVA
ncbi:catabolic enzyme [Bordetella ansorpii]|uniref:Catabolic enzyme n=1 Tax=Bordetella ansorpii TaxID=288768 RepID=A0A157P364_9BORD|nr:MmgE/PrpD family protein [Bordetella ansorpii]SAI28005.1 catabolic enzyme [Bordetella ansorpii]